MKAIRRKILIILTALFAAALCLIGVLMTTDRVEKLNAQAAEPSSGVLYFTPGISASANGSNLFRSRFQLNVTEAAFGTDAEELSVSLVSEYSSADSRISWNAQTFDDRRLTLTKSEITFTNGAAALTVYVSAPLYQDIQLFAKVGSNTALSDARSIFFVWQKMAESDFAGQQLSDSVKNYIQSAVSFTTDSEVFALSGLAQLSSEKGLSFLLNIPQSYTELLKSGPTVKSISKPLALSCLEYTDYFLVMVRASDLSDYGNTSANPFGEMYHADPTACIDPYKNICSQIPEDILDTSRGVISMNVPSDADTTYYYYAQIVKFVYTKTVLIGGSGYDDYEAEVTAFSSNYVNTTVKTLAEDLLSRNASMTESERAWIQDAAGIAPDTTEVTVTLKYKTMTDYATISEVSYPFKVKSVNAQNKTLIQWALYDLTEYNNLAKLNVVYTSDYWRDGCRYVTQERIILQAKDFEYTYDSASQTGTLEVVYNDFQYKDLTLRVTNNDPENNLTIDYYTSDVVVTGTNAAVTFRFEDVEEQLYNSCLWLFDLTSDSVRVSGAPAGVTVGVTDSALTVSFPLSAESSLVGLSLQAVAEIVEDVEYSLTYEYVSLSYAGDVNEMVVVSEPTTKMYSEIVTYNYTNFMADYGETVTAAVSPEFLCGATFYIPASIEKEYSAYDAETRTCKIVVGYTYNTVFKITNTYDGGVTFKALNHNSLTYAGDFFADNIPDGWRVESLVVPAAYTDKLSVTNAEDYTKTRVEVRTSTNAKEILPIVVNLTDLWHLEINYLTDYADYRIRTGVAGAAPCFAEKKRLETVVRVKDYADIYVLTTDDLKEILKTDDLSILGLATVASIDVSFDGVSAYTVDVGYSYAALKQIDYDGNVIEIKIPLTSYADWCTQYGQDWSILFLNTTERQYFRYSNDVSRENLYGFFSVAVFREQVSDLNYWFKNNTGDGCMTIFEGKQVNGSGLYKFFDNLTTKGVLTSVAGHVGMALCEILNDDNAMYYSYFFYLDGTSDNAFISNGGADNAGDTDGAIKNAWQNVKDWASEVWENFNNSAGAKVLKIILGVLVSILVVALFIKFFKWLFSGGKGGKSGSGKRRKRR